MKMYILIRDDVPLSLAVNTAAHASLACFREFEDDPDMQEWINGVFKKVTCMVNRKMFEEAKGVPRRTVLTESNWDNEEVSIAFCPRTDGAWPSYFKHLELYQLKADFPMQGGPNITRETAEGIYEVYAAMYTYDLGLDHIAERGGWGWAEVEGMWERAKRKHLI